ncbi:MAG: chromosome segregation protein SMC [Sphingomicrobium sp.]
MKLRRLKLSGFKSFVEPAELRIERGLTGIVGPNGCGKSNLLEAIRWAMGESSPKSLRGGGMDDVIFAGTATRPPRDFAEVSILLERSADDGDRGESEITRRIERGAGSAYRIDGRDVRAKDVSLLFADAATGAHSPALVSQGKIGAVIAAKPVERRLLLEEAAGIAGLHARRKDAEQKLRATEANLTRLGEILDEQEQRAGQLRRQARAAERYRKLTDQIRGVEARLLHARWAEAEHAAEAARAEAAAAEAEVTRIQTAIAEAQQAQDRANALLAERRNALAEAREQGHQLAHQLATARARRDTVERRLGELERLDAALSNDMAREEALKGDAVRALGQLESERTAIEQRLRDAEAHLARIATELTGAESASREAEAALADLLARQAAMRAERRVAEAALEASEAQLARIEQERRRLTEQLDALGDGSDLGQARADAEHKTQVAAEALAQAEARRAEAEQGRGAAADRRDAAETRLAAARAALSAAKSEHDALARALEHGGGSVLASLNAEAGYEHALAAALGEDAEAVIGDHDAARRWGGSEVLPTDPELPQGLACLADHVSAPAELVRRLKQVAVVDEDHGQPLAVGQRLVTRDGALRRWDGFVATGVGAAAAERLLRANRLSKLAHELPSLQQAVAGAVVERDSALADMERCRSEAEAARHAALAAERDAREAARAGDVAAASLERMEAQRSGLTQRKADLEPVIAAAADAVATARSALGALPDAAALEHEVGRARTAAAAAASAVAEKRAEAATRARETAADRERLSAAAREQGEWRKRQADAEQRLAQAVDRQKQQAAERSDLEKEPAELDGQIRELEHGNSESQVRIGEASAGEREAEEAVVAAGMEVSAANERFAAARERRAAASARAEAQQARSAEFAKTSVEKFECVPQRLPEKLAFDADEPRNADEEAGTLERLTAERERIGPVNLVAEAELAELDEARGKGAAEAEELTQAIHRLRGSIGNLNREGRVRLLEAYEQVDAHFRRLFTTLFDGGQAHLALVESDDPLEAGLEIMAQPPGKRLSTLTLLSGGEQALTAIALIFALFLTNPAPICVLDEVDAPLDDANVERFCDLLDRMTQETDTRYLIVTHNAVTMSRMHRLYGVTMIEKGVSRLVSVDLGGAETLLAAE